MGTKKYIGLTPNKEIDEIKNNFNILSYKTIFHPNSEFFHTVYLDQNQKKQLREETWEIIDRNTLRLISMKTIENNIPEGEQISLIWD